MTINKKCKIICKIKKTINKISILFKEEWNSSCMIVLLLVKPICIEGYAISINNIIFLVWVKLSSYSDTTVNVLIELVSWNRTKENNSFI